jgi:hypothetical protein
MAAEDVYKALWPERGPTSGWPRSTVLLLQFEQAGSFAAQQRSNPASPCSSSTRAAP